MENETALSSSETEFFESGGETEIESPEVEVEESSNVVENVTQEEVKLEVEQPREKMVPHAALHQARMEIKEMKEWKAQQERILQEIQARMNPQAPPPEVDTQPVDYFLYENQQIKQSVQQVQQQLQEKQNQENERAQDANIRRELANIEAEFVSKTPDYMESAAYLKQQVANDLYNRGVSQEDLGRAVDEQMKAMVLQSANMGANPAEFAYNLAKSRGFKSKPSIDTSKIASIQKGQVAAKSLSSATGSSKGEITLEAMAEMSDADLADNWHLLKKLT